MLYIDGVPKATGTGSTLGYNWNIRNVEAGAHLIQAMVKDTAGNASSSSVYEGGQIGNRVRDKRIE